MWIMTVEHFLIKSGNKILALAFLSIGLFISCADGANDTKRNFSYTVKNELTTPVSLLFYSDSLFQEILQQIDLNPKDSVFIYECSAFASTRICDPFEEESDFGSIHFEDGKTLTLRRSEDVANNLLLFWTYESYKISESQFNLVYSIDSSDYVLAE